MEAEEIGVAWFEKMIIANQPVTGNKESYFGYKQDVYGHSED